MIVLHGDHFVMSVGVNVEMLNVFTVRSVLVKYLSSALLRDQIEDNNKDYLST